MSRGLCRAFERARRTYREAAQAQARAAQGCAERAGPGPLGRVLEIGAGAGLLSGLLVPRASGLYVALDLSPLLLSDIPVSASSLARVAADAVSLPLVPGTFDFLASASALQWLPDPAVALPPLLDRLRPGGRFSLALFTAGTLAEAVWASQQSGFGRFWPLRPAHEYLGILSRVPGLDLIWDEEGVVIHYPTARAALESLRRTGACFSGSAPRPDRRALAAFLGLYAERFSGPRGLPLTYRVLYLHGRRG